jgi:hypothetical protein
VLRIIGIAVLLVSAGGVAFAGDSKGNDWQPSWWHHKPVSAPEIDPASAISGLSLLVGGLAVVRGRRGKK